MQARGDRAGALETIGEAERALPSPEASADMFFPVAAHGRASSSPRGKSPRRFTLWSQYRSGVVPRGQE